MLRTPFLLMLALLALAGTAVGCGDEDTATDSPAQEQSTPGGEEVQPSDQDVEAAIEDCKATVRDRPELSADAKAELEAICDGADGGDPEKVKEATREVCVRIVEEQVPEGEARDQALETCKTATQ